MLRSKKGFTLIEMLVVIAIIAVLVSIVIPVVGDTTTQAKAAADVANLRSVYSELNIHVINGDKTVSEIIDAATNPASTIDPDAKLFAVFDTPGFIHVYYINTADQTYYSMDYLSELAANGPDSPNLAVIGTGKPDVPGVWYQAGAGQVDPY